MACNKFSEKEEEKCANALRDLIANSDDELLQAAYRILAFDHDHHLVLMFLRCREFNIKSALERVRKFAYARKLKYSDFFDKVYPEYLKNALNSSCFRVLRNRDSNLRRVFVFRLSYWKPNEVPFDQIIGMIFLLGLEMCHEKVTQENGIVVLIDFGGISFDHIKQATPARLKKLVYVISNASPLKIKGIHFLSTHWTANSPIALIKMFLTPKLRDRIHNHGSIMDTLHKHLSPEILPITFGGHLSDEDALDHRIIDQLHSESKNEYYKRILNF